jgi:hypothetical protein
MDSSGDRIVTAGALFSVRYAVRASGKRPAEEFLGSLDRKAQMRLFLLMQRLCDCGRITNKQQFRKLRDEIWEFKRGSHRLFAYREDSVWYLTNGFCKSTKKLQDAAIEQAIRIRSEQIARMAP